MSARLYRTSLSRPQTSHTPSQEVRSPAPQVDGEIPLSAFAGYALRYSILITGSLLLVGYVRAVTLSWLFSAPITAFRLPIEETIAQGAMATVVITAAALYTAFGKWFGFVGLLLITLLALLYSALKNYVFRRTEPTKTIDLPEKHKRFLSDWGGQSIRLIDLFTSFLKVQFVCFLPIIIGMLSAIVLYSYAMQVDTKNQDRFVVSVPMRQSALVPR